jgi:para-nitrobenzyl esterase
MWSAPSGWPTPRRRTPRYGVAGALHAAWGAFAVSGDPGWARYEPGGRGAMIFAPDRPHLVSDPFAYARQAWAGLDWQPGTWWPLRGPA